MHLACQVSGQNCTETMKFLNLQIEQTQWHPCIQNSVAEKACMWTIVWQ